MTEQPKPQLTVDEVYDRIRDRLQRLGGNAQLIANYPAEIGAEESPYGEHVLILRIYTLLNSYQIKAVSRETTTSAMEGGGGGFDGYLGCTMSARRARPGEDWTRGNDLSDGPLTRNTLMRIYEDIIACEISSFCDECRGDKGQPAGLGPSDEASDEEQVAREAEKRWRES